MITLVAKNVHRALSHGLFLVDSRGVIRNSRNGPVVVAPFPVTTEYTHPRERVIFWPQRDANPFFHFYEACWVLLGRRDMRPLLKYAKQMADFSDDGVHLNGSAYGFRLRHFFGFDQIEKAVQLLKKNPDDRRIVLQMWSAEHDLGSQSKDVPCNDMATLKVNNNGALDLTVFCRSNDIVWGAYGANAVHFSMLQEYIALKAGYPVGTYRQVSDNYHIYSGWVFKLKDLPRQSYVDPYEHVRSVPMTEFDVIFSEIRNLIKCADEEKVEICGPATEWGMVGKVLLLAHEWYRNHEGEGKYVGALGLLSHLPELQDVDWIRAGREWVQRRFKKWQDKQNSQVYHESAQRAGEIH